MEFYDLMQQKLKLVDMPDAMLQRSVNTGFSGGEKKRNEILQMAVLEPRLAILDETDSGLDIFPRLVSPQMPEGYEPASERISTGITGLDEMLDGGVWRGSTTLLGGPSGAGKTTIALQFALAST